MREYMDIGLFPHLSGTYSSLQSIYNIFGQWDEATIQESRALVSAAGVVMPHIHFID